MAAWRYMDSNLQPSSHLGNALPTKPPLVSTYLQQVGWSLVRVYNGSKVFGDELEGLLSNVAHPNPVVPRRAEQSSELVSELESCEGISFRQSVTILIEYHAKLMCTFPLSVLCSLSSVLQTLLH